MILLVSDLHFSSRPHDEHFWDLFSKVESVIKSKGVTEVLIPGDLTTAKDNHNAKLVNHVVEGVVRWSKLVDVTILMGNHDYAASTDYPFFHFLGRYPNIQYINTPRYAGENRLYLPHSRDPLTEWKSYNPAGKLVFTHVTVKGAVYESGVVSDEGIEAEYFSSAKLAFSGDIHSHQQIGPLVYVGCPYHVRFNDKFTGGAILLDEEHYTWEHLPFDEFPRRRTVAISSASQFEAVTDEYRPGDQLKVRLILNQGNMHLWRQLKDDVRSICEKNKIQLCALELQKEHIKMLSLEVKEKQNQQQINFDSFCDSQNISAELREVGREILKEVG